MNTDSHEPTKKADLETETHSVELDASPADKTSAPEPAPEPEAKPKIKAEKTETKTVAPYAVVGGGETDDVLLSRCVYKNRVTRKSLSVHHLQRRLLELGHVEAGTDKDGWYGDHTFRAVKEFQERSGLSATGLVDADTLHAVFAGDPNVTVIIDA